MANKVFDELYRKLNRLTDAQVAAAEAGEPIKLKIGGRDLCVCFGEGQESKKIAELEAKLEEQKEILRDATDGRVKKKNADKSAKIIKEDKK